MKGQNSAYTPIFVTWTTGEPRRFRTARWFSAFAPILLQADRTSKELPDF
jgi:hypothetical protein